MSSIVFDGPVRPSDATAFVRTIPTPSEHALSAFLPDKLVTEQTIRLNTATRVNRTAKFRAFDAQPTQLERDFVESREVDLLPISIQGSKGELERLQLEKARQQGGSLAAITNAIYDDLEIAVRSIRNRVEVARGELLSTGKIQLQGENGLYLTADFGVPAGNFVAPTIPWTTVATATVVEDIAKWSEAYTTLNGFAPGGMIISRKTAGLLQRNDQFRSYANIVAGGPSLVSNSTVANVLSDFSLPPIVGIYDTVINVDGVDKRVIPEGKAIFVPPNASELGNVAYGVTATALELVNAVETDLSFSDAPGLTGVVVKKGFPYQETTVVDGLLLPVLNNPNALMVATVV